ncbi:MAG: membrane protein insertion efficiency factor YidD [Desulfovibrio sp.]|nr:membrane protein insertion efficiency factor YidD [Desulfovibrio sp.]
MTVSLLLRTLALVPVRLYRYCLSPLFPGCCRFYPTCSAYASEALLTHGALKGCLLTLFRLLRCQPLSHGGVDPVPPRGAWTARAERKRAEQEPHSLAAQGVCDCVHTKH